MSASARSEQFGREVCGQLDAATRREWLITNGIGGYACGTVASHLTRAYHGLLVAALNPPVGRSLLVTKLDETVTCGGRAYPLYTNAWGKKHSKRGLIEPHGYRHIEHFELTGTVPVWTFAIGEMRLQKQIWMVQGENTTCIRYYLERGSGVTLSTKVIVNHRNHHGGTYPGHWSVTPAESGIGVTVPNADPFYVVPSVGRLHVDYQWLDNVYLSVERYRGTGDRDSHLQAGVLNVSLEPGQAVTLVASVESTYVNIPIDGEAMLKARHRQDEALLSCWHEMVSSPPGDQPLSTPGLTDLGWLNSLVLAADAFIVDRAVKDNTADDALGTASDGAVEQATLGKTIIAGYPWFGDWGRDTMISLPGLTVAAGRPELARSVLQTFGQHLSQGMLPNLFPDSGHEPAYNTVDAVLWYFEAIRSYYEATQDRALLAELFPALADAIRWHQRGTRYGICVDPKDGLLYAGEAGAQLTWMDAKVDDWVVTPRSGKAVEVNALWHNALRIMAHFARLLGQPPQDYLQLAECCRRGFGQFWSEARGYCFDVLDAPEAEGTALRPNQIFAVALPYGGDLPGDDLLLPDRQKAVVDVVAAHLLTSYGLRSLAPSHPDYVGTYGGDRWQRDGAYHQGTVWAWLMGPFAQAHLKVYRDVVQAQSFLTPFADHLRDAGLGNVSEIFDGDAPHRPRGCFAQAWSVAEILRVWRVILSVSS